MSAIGELQRLNTTTGGPPRKKDNRAAFVFLLPWFAGLVLITAGPVAASFVLGFTDYNLIQPPEFSGVENFQRMLSDERLHQALAVTFKYVFISVPLQLAAALGLAMLLDRGLRGLAFYRSAFYLPSLLGSSVAIAVLWRQIFGADGLFNQALGLVGIEGRGWISDPDTALSTLIVLNVWTFGAPMVIFLAGLRQIPAMYYEAASVDGAGKATQFRKITIPLLSPIIFFNLVLQIIHAFQSFTQAFVVSGGSGGPSDSTLFYTLYLYQRGFHNFDMGYASALAWLLLLIIAAFTAVNFWAAKRWVFYDD
ncbi:sugar ABC transporter permease [Actinoplanes sp. NPDC024001]|uniref:carbohydrate ABC transporter permease n=1 Tax=Actinoplanes sp. NPDC024001 TaxID=3154598 RepID=UPI0033D4217B